MLNHAQPQVNPYNPSHTIRCTQCFSSQPREGSVQLKFNDGRNYRTICARCSQRLLDASRRDQTGLAP